MVNDSETNLNKDTEMFSKCTAVISAALVTQIRLAVNTRLNKGKNVLVMI